MSYEGIAGFNSVTFSSDNYKVTAKRVGNTIQLLEKKNKLSRKNKINLFLSKVPFVRGAWSLIISLAGIWTLYVILMLIGFILPSTPITFITLENSEPYEFIVMGTLSVLFLALIVIKLSQIAKYHAAEHQVSNTYDSGKALTLENVDVASRIHRSCGTNLVMFFVLFLFIFERLGVNLFLATMLGWSIGYEVFKIEGKRLTKLLKPFYLFGGMCQWIFLTSKPNKEHLDVAIEAFKRLQELDGNLS